MDAKTAAKELEAAGRQHQTAMRCVGYAALVQAIGWDGVAAHMPGEAVAGLRQAFDEAGIDPAELEFPEGPDEYLAEVARSSIHEGSIHAAKELLGSS
jgi:hypothetical protein